MNVNICQDSQATFVSLWIFSALWAWLSVISSLFMNWYKDWHTTDDTSEAISYQHCSSFDARPNLIPEAYQTYLLDMVQWGGEYLPCCRTKGVEQSVQGYVTWSLKHGIIVWISGTDTLFIRWTFKHLGKRMRYVSKIFVSI